MGGQSALASAVRRARLPAASGYVCRQCRAIQISAAPTAQAPGPGGDAFGSGAVVSGDTPDARFEVIGSPHSLLSVSLSASQRLYTRRGTLVSVAGKAENAISTLSLLSPFARAPLGVPFLYQRVTSSTPITALIGTKSPSTSFSVLRLDGTTDWVVCQRNALLAWTGHTLAIKPRIQPGLSPAYWGSSMLTGRGLAALASPGQVYQVSLAQGEELTVHPSHVAAYALGRHVPRPFRFRSSTLRLAVPSLPEWISSRLVPDRVSRFVSVMRDTNAFRYLARALYALRTATRRGIWGDRLFLHFTGPTTLLMSSRGVRVADALTNDDVNEIADAEPGKVSRTVEEVSGTGEAALKKAVTQHVSSTTEGKPPVIHVAEVSGDGRVRFDDEKELKEAK